MKKLLKNVCMCLLAVVVVCASAISLTACKKETDENQIMSLSLNPSIEFIVDKNDKVVSVSATNEDCAYILEKYNEFTGKSAKDAALKFLELCEEYGFVVEGDASQQEITISVSGEGAEKLYNDVKNKIKAKAISLGLDIANFIEIDKEELESIVGALYQEYTGSEIGQMSQEKLIEMIKSSRKETAGLYSEDEKQAYYRERAQEVLEAKMAVLNEYVTQNPSEMTTLLTQYVNAINSAYQNILSLYETLNSQIEELYNDQTEGINQIRDKYISMKNNYLEAYNLYKEAVAQNAANVNELKSQMEGYKETADTFKNELEIARDEAVKAQMHLLRTTIHNSVASINVQIDNLLKLINLSATNIQEAINEAIVSLKNSYEQSSENPWPIEPPAAS